MEPTGAFQTYQIISSVFSVLTTIYFGVKLFKVYSKSSCSKRGCSSSFGAVAKETKEAETKAETKPEPKPETKPKPEQEVAIEISPVIPFSEGSKSILEISPINSVEIPKVPTISRESSNRSLEEKQDRIVSQIMELKQELSDTLFSIKTALESRK